MSQKNLLAWLIILGLCTSFASFAPYSFAKQEPAEARTLLSEDQQAHLSLFSAMVANGEAWRSGDCLVRIVTTFDAVTQDQGEPTGLMTRAERLNRVVFDLEQGRFMRIHLGQSEVTNYQTDPPDSLQKTRWRGDCLDLTSKRYWTHDGSDSFKSGVAENPRLFLHHFPDYRCVPLQIGAMDKDLVVAANSFVEQIKGRMSSVKTMGLSDNRLRLTMVELTPKIQLSIDPAQVSENADPVVPKLIAEWTFDQTSLLPISSQTMLQVESREPQAMVKYVYRWENRDDVYVPSFFQSIADYRQRRTADGQSFLGTETTEYTFHWFSLNQKLDKAYFDGSKFRDEQTALKHVLPELTGAESLMNDPESSPKKSPPSNWLR